MLFYPHLYKFDSFSLRQKLVETISNQVFSGKRIPDGNRYLFVLESYKIPISRRPQLSAVFCVNNYERMFCTEHRLLDSH